MNNKVKQNNISTWGDNTLTTRNIGTTEVSQIQKVLNTVTGKLRLLRTSHWICTALLKVQKENISFVKSFDNQTKVPFLHFIIYSFTHLLVTRLNNTLITDPNVCKVMCDGIADTCLWSALVGSQVFQQNDVSRIHT